jgi:signal recognition particle subunit SRP54
MGDVLTLIEKAQTAFDTQKMTEMEERMRQNRFTLDDFMSQMGEMRKMGDMQEMLAMIPGMGKQLKNVQLDESQLTVLESIMQSMTPAERDNPALINGSRKKRIAAGCGRQVQDVNRLLKQFEQMQKMMKQLNAMQGGGGKGGKKKKGFGKGFQLPF